MICSSTNPLPAGEQEGKTQQGQEGGRQGERRQEGVQGRQKGGRRSQEGEWRRQGRGQEARREGKLSVVDGTSVECPCVIRTGTEISNFPGSPSRQPMARLRRKPKPRRSRAAAESAPKAHRLSTSQGHSKVTQPEGQQETYDRIGLDLALVSHLTNQILKFIIGLS